MYKKRGDVISLFVFQTENKFWLFSENFVFYSLFCVIMMITIKYRVEHGALTTICKELKREVGENPALSRNCKWE